MERVQTIVRLRPDLMTRLKQVARRENRSVNSFIEHALEKAAGLDYPKLPADFKVSEEILNLACFDLPRPTREELDNDPKYAYLYEKYIKE